MYLGLGKSHSSSNILVIIVIQIEKTLGDLNRSFERMDGFEGLVGAPKDGSYYKQKHHEFLVVGIHVGVHLYGVGGCMRKSEWTNSDIGV